MTAVFDYYQLAYPDEGVGSGFKNKAVPHITLQSIANNEMPEQETLYDQPLTDRAKMRVTGPFTVEAVPAPVVKPLGDGAAPDDANQVSSVEIKPAANGRNDPASGSGLRCHEERSIFLSNEPDINELGRVWLEEKCRLTQIVVAGSFRPSLAGLT